MARDKSKISLEFNRSQLCDLSRIFRHGLDHYKYECKQRTPETATSLLVLIENGMKEMRMVKARHQLSLHDKA